VRLLPAAIASGFWGSAAAMVASGLLIALLLGAAVFVAARPRRESAARRLARFGVLDSDPEPEEAPPARRGNGVRGGPLAAIERPLKDRHRWRRFEEELDVAGIEIAAIEILAATVAATALAMILIAALAPFAALALLGLLIPVAVRAAIDRKVRKVRQKFADSLADTLQVVASAIRAGHSMVGAFAVLQEEAAEPAKGEFRRIVVGERVGVPLEDSIREVARRMANRDMEQLALVAIIQRETGGNTAEMIDRVVETLRERAELRRMMAALTAQGRLSRGVITALPVVLLAILSLINPDYIAPLFQTAGGRIMLVLAGVLIAVGSLAIKRIVDVRA
jgi:tight adherence protein B